MGPCDASDPDLWSTVTAVASVVALAVSLFSAWWVRRSYVLAPRRDVLRRYVGNLWRLSEDNVKAGVDCADLWTALNEAKVAFGGDQRIVSLLNKLSTKGGQRETHHQLAVAMAKASGFSTKRWPDRYIETAITGKPPDGAAPNADRQV